MGMDCISSTHRRSMYPQSGWVHTPLSEDKSWHHIDSSARFLSTRSPYKRGNLIVIDSWSRFLSTRNPHSYVIDVTSQTSQRHLLVYNEHVKILASNEKISFVLYTINKWRPLITDRPCFIQCNPHVFFYTWLTHYGLVMPHGGIDLSQHWLRLWLCAIRHQAITWTIVAFPWVWPSDYYLRTILKETPQASITKISWKDMPSFGQCTMIHVIFAAPNELMDAGT